MWPQKRAGSLSNPEISGGGGSPRRRGSPSPELLKRTTIFRRTDAPVQREVRIMEIQLGNSLCFDNS